MGVSYLVFPLDSVLLEWARECSVPTDGVTGNGRPATLDELNVAAGRITGHLCQIHHTGEDFDLVVESEKRITFPCDGDYQNTIAPGLAIAPASSVHIMGQARAGGEIQRLGCRGDVDLLAAIVGELTSACGPQVIVADCDGIPWLITSPGSVPIGPEPWPGPLPEPAAERDTETNV